MNNNKKKKVLIVGASAKEYALAKYFAENDQIEEVYAAPGNEACEEFAKRIDIRETAVSELLEFVIKNDIDLTVACSADSIRADIATDFRENSQLIFAPDAESANFATSRSSAKKFLYKLHIPTPKFGVFEKSQLALDYLKNATYPLLITTDFDRENDVRTVCNNITQAQTCINDIFAQDNNKAVIEEYQYGHPFTFYVITDGYQAIPLGIVGDYKFREDGDAGLFTLGMGAFLPDYKISGEQVTNIMDRIINPILKALQSRQKPYVGIFGIEGVLKNDSAITVTGITPFLKDHDAQAVIKSIGCDLYNLFEACVNGYFADDYDDIPIKDLSIISCVLYSRKDKAVVTGLELADDTTDIGYFATSKNKFFEVLTNPGRTIVVTQSSATLTRAKELLYDNIENIYFDGIKYRHDICSE
ncbi:hypothetical protein IKP85_03490 [bacterium]|nr:hypothetical protein [bacterium]